MTQSVCCLLLFASEFCVILWSLWVHSGTFLINSYTSHPSFQEQSLKVNEATFTWELPIKYSFTSDVKSFIQPEEHQHKLYTFSFAHSSPTSFSCFSCCCFFVVVLSDMTVFYSLFHLHSTDTWTLSMILLISIHDKWSEQQQLRVLTV